ncbi:hypothetical protein ARMGADRAFT_1084567 [Armillaria gallica]|uniref:Uncharacterized protein n=1 Tax=Armillaria gallica TaxID=47427 RepID=A0A2H3CZZ0_ARMGA|nr:hypothetical protein ARMGADRAFT_1084567 [Armillaria gallica]
MTDQCSSKHTNDSTPDNAVLAVIFSTLQLSPAQHKRIVQIITRIQLTLAPQPVVAPIPSPVTLADFEVWRRTQALQSGTLEILLLVPDPNPVPVHVPIPTPTPAPAVVPVTAPVPATAPVAQPARSGLIPFGPLPDDAIIVPDGFDYHIPHAHKWGPYYLVAQHLDVGIYAGWEATAALIIGISGKDLDASLNVPVAEVLTHQRLGIGDRVIIDEGAEVEFDSLSMNTEFNHGVILILHLADDGLDASTMNIIDQS